LLALKPEPAWNSKITKPQKKSDGHMSLCDMWPRLTCRKKMPLEPLQAQRHPYLSQFATADWCSKIAVQKYRSRGRRGEMGGARAAVYAAASAI
jgi:hypothetical protein